MFDLLNKGMKQEIIEHIINNKAISHFLTYLLKSQYYVTKLFINCVPNNVFVITIQYQ